MKVCVVGAGLGGLACALRLQAAGHEVVVLEQGPAPGGRAGRIRDAGFTWDTGPSLLTMPWVLEETVRRRRAGPGPSCRSAASIRSTGSAGPGSSDHLDFVSDVVALRGEIARLSPRDAAALDAFLAAAADLRAGRSSAPAGARSAPRTRALAARRCCASARHGRLAPHRALLRAPARARGVLVPLAVHRRRPVPRPGGLRARWCTSRCRRRLVLRGRRVRARRGAGARAWTCAAARAPSASSTAAGGSAAVALADG